VTRLGSVPSDPWFRSRTCFRDGYGQAAEAALQVPLIGFSGRTLQLSATYMIEGGVPGTPAHKRMMFQGPDLFCLGSWRKITENVVSYLDAQIRAGAQAVRSSTPGSACCPAGLRVRCPAVVRRSSPPLRAACRVIYFASTAGPMLNRRERSGEPMSTASIGGLTWLTLSVSSVPTPLWQGNLDPCLLFGPRTR